MKSLTLLIVIISVLLLSAPEAKQPVMIIYL